ncbi:MAG: hypothetical protein ACXWDI_13995 [Nocardioides sp.]
MSEDGSHVLMVLAPERARELAGIISALSLSSGGDSAWTKLSAENTGAPWLCAMLHLIRCSQNIRH